MKTRPWGEWMKSPKAQMALVLASVASGLFAILFITALAAADDSSISTSGKSEVKTEAAAEKTVAASTNVAAPSTSTNAGVVTLKLPPDLSALNLKPELEEIVKMAQAGIGEEVLKQYVAQSKYSYKDLTPQEIITLNDLGVPSAVVSEMLKKAGKPQLNPQEQTMVVSTTNEVITTTAEKSMASGEAKAEQSTNQPSPQQLTTPVQVYTQTVYVPVQTEQQPQVVIQQQPVVVQQPLPQTVVVYYSALAPYGSWMYVDGLGYCWQPLVAVTYPDWRPYYHGGHWVWTDYGWYWLSDYSWGWAPFHYGRWHYLAGHGWIWFPDTVWGPAWVSWRVSPYYCGWAPLPPSAFYSVGVGFLYHGSRVSVGFEFGLTDWHYTFVDWRYFHYRDFYRYGRPGYQVRDVYNNTTVINNYITGNNNNVVINTGVGTEHIARVTREEVRKVIVRDAPAQGNKGLIYPERLVKDGNNIVLYRPNPQTPLLAKETQGTPKSLIELKQSGGKLIQPVSLKQPITSLQRLSPNAPENLSIGKANGNEKSKEPITGSKIGRPVEQVQPNKVQPQIPPKPISERLATTGTPSVEPRPSLPARPSQPSIAPQPVIKSELPTSDRKPIVEKPQAPSKPIAPSAPVKSAPATPIQPKQAAPSTPGVSPSSSRIESPKVEIAKAEPVKTAQPIVTHLWSGAGSSTKPIGAKPDPILKNAPIPSSGLNSQITPGRIVNPPLSQPSQTDTDSRFRSPLTPSIPSSTVSKPSAPAGYSIPVNQPLTGSSPIRESHARLNDTGNKSTIGTIQTAPIKTQPVPVPIISTPVQRITPSSTPGAGGTMVMPLPAAPSRIESRSTFAPQRSAPSYSTPTPPVAPRSVPTAPAYTPSRVPSYSPTPAPSRIESYKSTSGYMAPSSGVPGASRSYSAPSTPSYGGYESRGVK